MDIDTIPPGVDFTEYVRRAVGSCDVLLAFSGDRWLDLTDESGRRRIDDPADWVVQEIRVALARDVRVIPVLVEGAAMPTPAQLPESLWSLVNRQALPAQPPRSPPRLPSAGTGRRWTPAPHPRRRPAFPARSPPRDPAAGRC